MKNINIIIMTFHKALDEAFEKIKKLYVNHDNDLDKQKEYIAYVYDNEGKWRAEEIRKLLTPKHWRIDEKGKIIRVL
jgi:hypothetical protein